MKSFNIAVTGYFGTGSSAVIDLLREYKGVRVVPEIGRLYEHEAFYYPGGLFDLYSLLGEGNTPQGSDIYVNNFIASMKRLNDYDYVWYGSYQKLFGDSFMNLVNDFVASISEKREGSNSYHNIKSRFSIIKALMQFLAGVFYKKKIVQYGCKYIKDGNPVYFSMPTQGELEKAAQQFTDGYFKLFNNDECIGVYDHLIWPQQVNSHQKCFSDNLKVIVVNRDPRDVFLSSKYVWCKPGIGNSIGKPHFGDNPKKFAEEWRRTVVRNITNPNALHIYFEDLIYKYTETVKLIEDFLGLSPEAHINPRTKFQPEKSIENTQVFTQNDSFAKEAKVIEDYLPEYLYPFEYRRQADINNMFDSPND